MSVGLWRKMVGEDERLNEMKVEVGRHFLRVYSAGVRILLGVTNDIQLL